MVAKFKNWHEWERACVCVCVYAEEVGESQGTQVCAGPDFGVDKDPAPCLRAIVSVRKWPLHHPARDGIHL